MRQDEKFNIFKEKIAKGVPYFIAFLLTSFFNLPRGLLFHTALPLSPSLRAWMELNGTLNFVAKFFFFFPCLITQKFLMVKFLFLLFSSITAQLEMTTTILALNLKNLTYGNFHHLLVSNEMALSHRCTWGEESGENIKLPQENFKRLFDTNAIIPKVGDPTGNFFPESLLAKIWATPRFLLPRSKNISMLQILSCLAFSISLWLI